MRLKDYSWSKSGKLATGGGIIASALTSKEITLQADFQQETGGSGAGYYTIEFGVSPPASGSCNPEAEILWKVGGNSIRRLVSVINGTVVSGAGQSVSLRIFDNTIPIVPQPYLVDVQIVAGCRPSEQQPPRLDFPRTLASIPTPSGPIILIPGANGPYEIPNDAGVISFFALANRETPVIQQIQPGDLLIEMFGNGILNSVIDVTDANQWVPLPPGVSSITFQDNYLVGTLRAR